MYMSILKNKCLLPIQFNQYQNQFSNQGVSLDSISKAVEDGMVEDTLKQSIQDECLRCKLWLSFFYFYTNLWVDKRQKFIDFLSS